MSPADVEGFVDILRGRGLTYLVDGVAKDLVVVDQLRGPLARCDWIGSGRISFDGDPNKKVAACRMEGSTQSTVVVPEGWTFEQSLSASFGFVPNEHIDKSLRFLRHEGGLDVYENELTGPRGIHWSNGPENGSIMEFRIANTFTAAPPMTGSSLKLTI
jgi:hypothetical protein